MFIQITKTPPGRAPEEIRRMWIGIVLFSQGRETDPSSSDFPIGDENRGGYVVAGPVAMEALSNQNRDEAWRYWRSTFPWLRFGGHLLFAAEVCEELDI